MKIFNLIFFFLNWLVHQLLEGPPVPLMEQHTGPQFGRGSPPPITPSFSCSHSTAFHWNTGSGRSTSGGRSGRGRKMMMMMKRWKETNEFCSSEEKEKKKKKKTFVLELVPAAGHWKVLRFGGLKTKRKRKIYLCTNHFRRIRSSGTPTYDSCVVFQPLPNFSSSSIEQECAAYN